MVVIYRYTEPPDPCQYLPDRQSSQEFELVARISPEEYEARMNAGWRKFGAFLFHPVCADCAECRPIRILADQFTPDRSQRRTLKDNADLTVRLAQPTVDADRMALWHRYHAGQAARKGWPAKRTSTQDYILNFVRNPIPAIEITVYEGETLLAVVLTEITPNVVSGVYHYHDPDRRERGLGTFGMLQTLELARRLGKPYAYFGYYVAGCASMNYKSKFRPCQILGPDGVWRDFP
jgi:arginyl-tRNA--protein-N-Asp/Glu arginylyltransferase